MDKYSKPWIPIFILVIIAYNHIFSEVWRSKQIPSCLFRKKQITCFSKIRGLYPPPTIFTCILSCKNNKLSSIIKMIRWSILGPLLSSIMWSIYPKPRIPTRSLPLCINFFKYDQIITYSFSFPYFYLFLMIYAYTFPKWE